MSRRASRVAWVVKTVATGVLSRRSMGMARPPIHSWKWPMTRRWPHQVEPLLALHWVQGGEVMSLGFVQGVVRATMRPLMVLAALALLGTTGVPSPAAAQVKAPTKAKLRPAAKAAPRADPRDNVADQLNAKWRRENGGSSGFTTTAPTVVPASFAAAALCQPVEPAHPQIVPRRRVS